MSGNSCFDNNSASNDPPGDWSGIVRTVRQIDCQDKANSRYEQSVIRCSWKKHDFPNAFQHAALKDQTLPEARTNVCKRKRRCYSGSARPLEMSTGFLIRRQSYSR